MAYNQHLQLWINPRGLTSTVSWQISSRWPFCWDLNLFHPSSVLSAYCALEVNYCLNDGTCYWNNMMTKVQCSCREPYYGEQCEIRGGKRNYWWNNLLSTCRNVPVPGWYLLHVANSGLIWYCHFMSYTLNVKCKMFVLYIHICIW